MEVCPEWTTASLYRGGSSSPPPARPSVGCLSPSDGGQMKWEVAFSFYNGERCPWKPHHPALTWLANMREHLVSSVGSAVILRINCSMGVIPDGKTWVSLVVSRNDDVNISDKVQCHHIVQREQYDSFVRHWCGIGFTTVFAVKWRTNGHGPVPPATIPTCLNLRTLGSDFLSGRMEKWPEREGHAGL